MKRVLFFILVFCLSAAAASAAPAQLLFKKTSSSKPAALTGYLLNMHLVYQDTHTQDIAGNTLPLKAIGAADILYSYKPSADFAEIYKTRQNEIQKHLAKELHAFGAPYQPGPQNAEKERAFIDMLGQSIQNGFYFYSGGLGPVTTAEAHGARQCVKEAITKALKNLKNKAALHPAADNAFNTNFYLNAAQDCGVCSYAICDVMRSERGAPAAALGAANGWNLISLYRITVLPAPTERILRSANGEKNFFSPNGRKYVSWEYHSAALFVLEKNGEVIYLAADPLLLKNAVDFASWAALFDQKARFILRPFDGSVKLENGKNIIPKRNLPKGSVSISPFLD